MRADLKQRVIDCMFNDYQDSMFDKHGRYDIIMYGSSFPGLKNMTDAELLEDYESMVESDDELLAEIKADIAVDKMLE